MWRIQITFRRNSDGERCTIVHHCDSHREALRWITCIENALENSEDEWINTECWEEKE